MKEQPRFRKDSQSSGGAARTADRTNREDPGGEPPSTPKKDAGVKTDRPAKDKYVVGTKNRPDAPMPEKNLEQSDRTIEVVLSL
ncbi:hypothetical protein IGI04_003519 [Brassica rapa subsp. trilocularis]|uniref:Uncharacterized protein n=1 Tax=Brassica rapa subsp. trilocularis TaxID=1813537 RepID=A0ABQ7NYN5_BRACM|nr:hypothetical protein IGI04_003519 [Brassica rapa subsp. trilocularis]